MVFGWIFVQSCHTPFRVKKTVFTIGISFVPRYDMVICVSAIKTIFVFL